MREFFSPAWQVLTEADTFVLLSKKMKEGSDWTPFTRINSLDLLDSKFKSLGAKIGPFATLERYALNTEKTEKGITLTFSPVWSCQKSPPIDFDLIFILQDHDKKELLQKILPTSFYMFPPKDWKENEFILNTYSVFISPIPESPVKVLIGLISHPYAEEINFQIIQGNNPITSAILFLEEITF